MYFFCLVFRTIPTVWCSNPYLQFGIKSHIFSSTFRAIIQFDIRSHIFSLEFEVFVRFQFSIQSHHISFSFGIQSRIFSLTFRAMVLVQYLESSYPMQFGVQSHIFSLTFRVVVCFQFGIQSLHISSFLAFKATSSGWNSESLFVFSLAFKVVICSFSSIFIVTMSFFHLVFRAVGFFQFDIPNHHVFLPFGVQSRVFHLAFRAMSLVRHSKPLFVIDIQSHHVFLSSSVQSHCLVWRSKPYLQFGIQSHCFFLVQHSEPSCLSSIWSLESLYFLSFGVQSCVFILAFRAIVQLGIWCHCLFLVLAFRVIVHTHSSILSHHFFSLLSFKVISPQPCHLESLLQAFILIGIAYLVFTNLHASSFSSPHYFVLIASSPCSSRLPLPLHITYFFEFAIHILVMLLDTSRLAFSCGSHRAVYFEHILSCAPRWFDRYSSLTSTFESLLEMSQRESGSLV